MRYFGTDGIRGSVLLDLDMDLIISIAKSLTLFNNKLVCIATDTRESKDMIKSLITGVLLACGMDVYDLEVVTTPMLILYSYKYNMIGVMITASHNPYYDNGVKIFNCGYKLSTCDECMLEDSFNKDIKKSSVVGKKIIVTDFSYYQDFLSEYLIKSNKKIVIDCANGSSYKIANEIFSQVVDNLIIINNKPNGSNINNKCGSTNLDMLKKSVLDNNYDLGFAYDGDADRVLLVDKCGNEIDGESIIYILACYLKSKNQLKENKVVLTNVCNYGIIKSLNKNEIDVINCDVGDKFVIETINNNNLSLGGEGSGHIILNEIFHSGDAILVTLYLLKIFNEIDINYFLKNIEYYYSKSENIEVFDKFAILDNLVVKQSIIRINNELKDGYLIVRPSGTQNMIRIYICAYNKVEANKYFNEIINIIKGVI